MSFFESGYRKYSITKYRVNKQIFGIQQADITKLSKTLSKAREHGTNEWGDEKSRPLSPGRFDV
ncbi:MAG TPA: hypothetical protein PKW95_08280 [bacterium]|nr:hypothetical protein [bacterium]